jgi:hypothetical protein
MEENFPDNTEEHIIQVVLAMINAVSTTLLTTLLFSPKKTNNISSRDKFKLPAFYTLFGGGPMKEVVLIRRRIRIRIIDVKFASTLQYLI